MAQVSIYTKYSISIPNAGVIEIGSLTTPAVITLDSTAPDILVGRTTLADNAEAALTTAFVQDYGYIMPDFKVFICYCSVDMTLVFVGATGNSHNSAITVKGGTYFHLTSDDTKDYDASAGTRVGDVQPTSNILEILVGNNSGSTGYCQFWLVR